nr:1962_t:CDS:2 [Entrophospora candida]
MVNAQKYLDENYPKNERKYIRNLDIACLLDTSNITSWRNTKSTLIGVARNIANSNSILTKKLEGHLDLRDFENLNDLRCFNNLLKSIDLNNNSSLIHIECQGNQLQNVEFLAQLPCPEKLVYLDIRNNNFPIQNLFFLNPFDNLEILYIGNNKFYGSLEPLRNMKRIKTLAIENTDIKDGLKYLPLEEMESFSCSEKNTRIYRFWDRKSRLDESEIKSILRKKHNELLSELLAEYGLLKKQVEEVVNNKLSDGELIASAKCLNHEINIRELEENLRVAENIDAIKNSKASLGKSIMINTGGALINAAGAIGVGSVIAKYTERKEEEKRLKPLHEDEMEHRKQLLQISTEVHSTQVVTMRPTIADLAVFPIAGAGLSEVIGGMTGDKTKVKLFGEEESGEGQAEIIMEVKEGLADIVDASKELIESIAQIVQ